MQDTPTTPVVTDPSEQVVGAIKKSLSGQKTDVEKRNTYINKRRRYIYEEGLFEGLDFSRGRDKTMYNFLDRTCEIQTSQFMGRGFSIYSNYNKEDLSIYSDPQEQQQAELKNKKLKINAETRKKVWDAIVADNGGFDLFMRGARLGSEGGNTVYKCWFDKKQNKYRINLIENVNNYWAGWASSDFREKDFDCYMYQISEAAAYRDYGSYLKDGETFKTTPGGLPLAENIQDTDVYGGSFQKGDEGSTQTSMVTVIDYTGYLPGYSFKDGKPVTVKRGEEERSNVVIVGDKLCHANSDDKYLPDYYFIPNRHKTNWPYGLSDISDSAIDINKTFVYAMSTGVTLYYKEIAPTYLAKGYGSSNLPKRQGTGTTTMIPMELQQSLELLEAPATYVGVTKQLLDELKENYVREVGIGRVLFDDPSINPTSNQALMTTLKPVVDKAEAKQKIWEPIILQMARRALEVSAQHVKELKDAVAEPGWDFYVEWPSVLRKEDAAYQQMWLNLYNANVISIDTYLEKVGIDDTSEEIDRSRDDMKDPVKAAIRSRQLGVLAQQVISPQTGQPPSPQIKYNVNVNAKTDENPDMNAAVIGEVMGGQPDAFPGEPAPAQDPANPTLTPDQNTGQTASQPGSGATAVSPEGAINMANQQQGA
jgi:hypothetical protein